MVILILDDDKSRHTKLFNFWLAQATKAGAEKFDYHWIKTCDDLLAILLSNKAITHISLDHDLGESMDVSRALSKMCNEDPENFDTAFKDKIVVIHSANPIGAQNIANKLYGICESVSIIPICQMN